MKKSESFQRLLSLVNYYLSIGIIGTFTENFLLGRTDVLSNFVKKLIDKLSILYPRDFTLILFFIISILNFFVLNIQKNKTTTISFLFNSIVFIILLFVGFFFFINR